MKPGSPGFITTESIFASLQTERKIALAGELVAIRKSALGDIIKAWDDTLTHQPFVLAVTHSVVVSGDTSTFDIKQYIDRSHLEITDGDYL